VCKNFRKLYEEYDRRHRGEHDQVIGPVTLSKKLGISKTYVYNLLDGSCTNVSIKILAKIAVFFNVSIEELLDVSKSSHTS
jgi:DNA-binding Xre family transcriptional regulator